MKLSDLEDDIELPTGDVDEAEVPRRLSRLKKAKILNLPEESEGVDTPENDGRSIASKGAVLAHAADDDHANEDVDNGDTNPHQVGPIRGSDGQEGEEYWDEEDEIEQYYAERGEHDGSDSSDSGESDAEEGDGAPKQLGDNPTLDDLNAETQRILRQTAARDRLGKGQKIEIKPLTGIAERLRQRRDMVIARAPKLRAPDLPSFDDVLAATAHDPVVTLNNAAKNILEPTEGKDGDGATTPQGSQLATDADLEIISDGEDVDNDGRGNIGFRVVTVPGTASKAPKSSPLVFNPYSGDGEEEEFEEDPLIDDGLSSGDESDSESDHSWKVQNDDNEEEGVEGPCEGTKKSTGQVKQVAVDATEEAESSEDDEEADDETEDDELGNENEEMPDIEQDYLRTSREENLETSKDPELAGVLLPQQKEDAVALLAATDALPRQVKDGQRKFLDMEAELSDEDGDALAVSDDEDEDNLDDNGELADLITHEKASEKDKNAAEELHVQWARQEDAKNLQQVLRGLENGFRRRRDLGGSLDDLDGAMNGRWRRARMDDDDDGLVLGAAFAWPSGFVGQGGNDDEEECEDEAMLQRAKERRLLAGSQNAATSPGRVPLDEDSQAVLGLLARSQSQTQQGPLPAIRTSMEFWSNGQGSALARGPSFLGRQTATHRTQSSGVGLGGGRSFVFGRSENSNSSAPPENGFPGSQNVTDGGNTDNAGPVSFANLRQLADLPGNTAGNGFEHGGRERKRKATTLVHRLKNQSSGPLGGSQESLHAVNAVCKQITLAQGGTRFR